MRVTCFPFFVFLLLSAVAFNLLLYPLEAQWLHHFGPSAVNGLIDWSWWYTGLTQLLIFCTFINLNITDTLMSSFVISRGTNPFSSSPLSPSSSSTSSNWTGGELRPKDVFTFHNRITRSLSLSPSLSVEFFGPLFLTSFHLTTLSCTSNRRSIFPATRATIWIEISP